MFKEKLGGGGGQNDSGSSREMKNHSIFILTFASNPKLWTTPWKIASVALSNWPVRAPVANEAGDWGNPRLQGCRGCCVQGPTPGCLIFFSGRKLISKLLIGTILSKYLYKLGELAMAKWHDSVITSPLSFQNAKPPRGKPASLAVPLSSMCMPKVQQRTAGPGQSASELAFEFCIVLTISKGTHAIMRWYNCLMNSVRVTSSLYCFCWMIWHQSSLYYMSISCNIL